MRPECPAPVVPRPPPWSHSLCGCCSSALPSHLRRRCCWSRSSRKANFWRTVRAAWGAAVLPPPSRTHRGQLLGAGSPQLSACPLPRPSSAAGDARETRGAGGRSACRPEQGCRAVISHNLPQQPMAVLAPLTSPPSKVLPLLPAAAPPPTCSWAWWRQLAAAGVKKRRAALTASRGPYCSMELALVWSWRSQQPAPPPLRSLRPRAPHARIVIPVGWQQLQS